MSVSLFHCEDCPANKIVNTLILLKFRNWRSKYIFCNWRNWDSVHWCVYWLTFGCSIKGIVHIVFGYFYKYIVVKNNSIFWWCKGVEINVPLSCYIVHVLWKVQWMNPLTSAFTLFIADSHALVWLDVELFP